jgi:hypothetical protein
MKYYDLYGTKTMTTDETQGVVARTLSIEFQRRYHDDIGYYYPAEQSDEVYHVEPNYTSGYDEEEILEPEFADNPVLVRVSRTARGDELRDLLLEIPGLEHLRRDP